jgi:hypothetical protein
MLYDQKVPGECVPPVDSIDVCLWVVWVKLGKPLTRRGECIMIVGGC